MADDDKAQTSLIFDASGAKQGAAEFKAAADQVVAADAAVGQAADKTADTVTKAEGKKTSARKTAAAAAAEASRAQIAAAAAAGDATVAATDRAVTSYSRQTRFLDQLARSFDPLGAAANTAANKLQALLDITAKGGPNAQRAADMVGQAVDRLVAAQQAMSGGVGRGTAEFSRLQAIFDPLTVSAQRMTGELRELNDAQKAGVNIAGGYANAWQNIVEKYDEGAMAAKRAAAEQRTLIEQARATQTAANAQTGINQTIGVKDPTQVKSAQQSASVFEEEFAADEKLLAERKALEAELNPLKTASLAYEDALKRVDRAVELHVINAKQGEVQTARITDEFAKANAPLGNLNQKLGEHGKVSGNAAFAQRQLGVQTIQFFSSVQGGAPILTAFIQQGHQLLDVAFATGTGFGALGQGIKTAFGYLISPIGLMVAAAAGLAALGVAAETSARRLGTLRNQLGGVRDDAAGAVKMADDAARHLAATTSLGTNEARSAAGTILGAREFQGDQTQIEALIVAAQKHSTALGEDLPASAERMKKGLMDPAAFAQEMADKQLKGLDQALVNEVKRLQEAGDKAHAFDLVLHAVQGAVAGAKESLTPLQEALQKLGEAFNRVGSNGHSLAEDIGTAVAGALAKIVDVVTAVLSAIETVTKAIEKLKALAPAGTQGPGDAAGDALKWLMPGYAGKRALDAMTGTSSSGVPTGQQVKVGGNGVGMFQIEPGAASDVGMTLAQRYDYGQNITGGLKYFRQQYEATGNLDDATRAYNAGVTGAQEGRGTGYLAGVKSQNIANMPAQSKADIETAFGTIFADYARTLAGPQIRDRIMQIALQESGGQHFTMTARAPGEGAQTGRGQVTQSSGAGGSSGAVTASGAANVSLVDDAVKKADTMGLPTAARTAAFADIQKFQEALAKLREENKQDTPEFIKLQQALEASQLAFQEAVPPAEKMTEALDRQKAGQDRITAAYGQGSAAVAQVTAEVRAEEEARTQAAVGTQKYIQLVGELTQKYLANADAEQKTALGKQVQDIALAVQAQHELAGAYGQGEAAVVRNIAASKAEVEARDMARRGLADYATAKTELTAGYVAEANAVSDVALKQKMLSNDNQMALVKGETSALLMNNEARTIYLAKLQAEIDLKSRGLPIDDAAAKQYIANAAGIAQATTDLANQKQALSGIAGAFSSAFDTIGNAMTQAFISGNGAAVNWRNVMVSVAQQILQQFLKLAVLNPILNNLFGQNLDTVSSVMKALNNTTPGSTTTSGGDSGGIFGTLAGLAMKAVGLFGGGGLDMTAGATGAAGIAEASSAAAGMGSGASYGGNFSISAAHTGGIVGMDGSPRQVDRAVFNNAPRFHGGLGANEFATILERGERVLTGRQQQQMAAAANNNTGPAVINFNFPATTEPDTFRRAASQVAGQVQGALARARMRNG